MDDGINGFHIHTLHILHASRFCIAGPYDPNNQQVANHYTTHLDQAAHSAETSLEAMISLTILCALWSMTAFGQWLSVVESYRRGKVLTSGDSDTTLLLFGPFHLFSFSVDVVFVALWNRQIRQMNTGNVIRYMQDRLAKSNHFAQLCGLIIFISYCGVTRCII